MTSEHSIGKWRLLACLLALLLAVSGTIPHTANAFGSGTAGPDVYAMQGMLKSLGYYAGPIDGSFGPLTAAGVKAFQRQYGLSATGAVDSQTLESILWAYGNLKIPRQPQQTPQTPQTTPDKQTEDSLSAEELRMIELVNSARAANGLPALIADSALSNVARTKSADMISNHYFAHESPTYGSPFDMMQQFGISYRTAGENIACNQEVERAHQALMNSEGHRNNILDSQFTHIGIGIVDGGTCGKMFTQMFISR